MEIHGRLARTGVGPVDDSYFITFAGLDFLAALCSQDTALRQNSDHEAMCLPDHEAGKVTAVLLQLAPQARLEQVKFAVSQIAGVKVVEGNRLLTSSRQALRSLLVGVAVFSGIMALAILILVSLLFSAIVQERTRELGLLRAVGTTRRQVKRVVRYEAVITSLIGGVLGIVVGTVLAVLFTQPLDDFTLSIPILTLIALFIAAGIAGVGAAILPARRAARLDVLDALAYE